MKSIRNIFSVTILLAVALAFTGCQGEEPDLFEKSAAERLNEIAKDYTAVLAESEAGWIMEYYPTNSNEDPTGLGYLMLVDFDKNGSVKIGMMNDLTEGAYEEATSLWEIITDNGPVLSFSTYNEILHYFSDPALYDQGLGLEGDYEFVMVDVPEDHQTIMLKGKKRSTYVRLTRLPAGTDFQEYLADVYAFQKSTFPSSAPNCCVLTVGDSIMEVDKISTTLPNIYPYGGDAIANESYHPFIITQQNGSYNLRFRAPLFSTADEEVIQEFVYDSSGDIFRCVANSEYTLAGATPSTFFVDEMNAGKSWRMTRTSTMSEAAKTLVEALYTGLRGRSLTFNNIAFTSLSEDNSLITLCLTYRNNRNATYRIYFDYPFEVNGNQITLGAVQPREASQTIYNAIPALADFLNALSGTSVVKKDVSAFNLSTLTLSSQSGNGVEIVFTRI